MAAVVADGLAERFFQPVGRVCLGRLAQLFHQQRREQADVLLVQLEDRRAPRGQHGRRRRGPKRQPLLAPCQPRHELPVRRRVQEQTEIGLGVRSPRPPNPRGRSRMRVRLPCFVSGKLGGWLGDTAWPRSRGHGLALHGAHR